MTSRKSKSNWLWLLLILLFVFAYFQLPSQKGTKTTPTSIANTPTVKGTSTQENFVPTDQSAQKWYEVYFTSPKIPFDKVYQGGIEKYLIEKIDGSKTSIDLAVFEFNIESVAQALIKAKDRGVVIRVVYDDEHTDPDPQMNELISAGIPATPDKRSAFMHNKFFVFDDQCIWTGSFNISMNAAYRNNENALYFCSAEAAKNYETEFAEMFSGAFGPSSPSDTPFPEFKVDGVVIDNYFAPEDHVMEKVINAVGKAQSTIHFMTYSFTEDKLGQEMLAKAASEIKVEGIFESVGADTEYSECGVLLKKGLDVRLDGNPKTFHHKVIIIDGDTVILGSFNFSSNADTQNDENLLIVHDPRLAKDYEQQYQLMKQQAYIPLGNSCSK
jgi:phosphatidylserine/phosphatidylglycerophosphate/cardiolipin synthase-like enzyme